MATLFLIVIYLAFISLGIPDSMLGAAWPVMHGDIGAPFGSAGMLSIVASCGTIVSSLASGRLIQRIGTGWVTLVSCCLTAGALLGFAFVPTLGWLIVLCIPLGLGAGAVDSGLNHFVAANYKAHHMSWLHCFWGVGATAGPIIMSHYITTEGSWRNGYMAVAMIQFVLVFILFVTLPLWKKVVKLRQAERLAELGSQEPLPASATGQTGSESVQSANSQPPRSDSQANQETVTSRASLFRLPGVRFTLLTFFFYCGVETTVGLWGASFLVGSRQIEPGLAAGWISLYFAGITIGRLITGFLTLRVTNRMLILLGQLCAAIGTLLLMLPMPNVLLMTGLILIGIGLAPIFPGLLHETPARFGTDNSARLMGYQMAVAYTGITLLPPLFGLVAAYVHIGLFPFVIMAFILIMLFCSERVIRAIRQPKIS
ncbi:MFS transporter [Paenibacillus campi]|uniref:MFS transporter n=1 Tax=Paenibacillus campi TaxID=3106031 RepID=UPI002AFF1C60|nr:MFS transporter [Paenibacillus sp. SGZ-1014]